MGKEGTSLTGMNEIAVVPGPHTPQSGIHVGPTGDRRVPRHRRCKKAGGWSLHLNTFGPKIPFNSAQPFN